MNSVMNYLSFEREACTANMDVIKILEARGDVSFRDFSMYETYVRDSEDKFCTEYFIMMEEDVFPIIISEDMAKKILENPEIGESLVYNTWFNRYR